MSRFWLKKFAWTGILLAGIFALFLPSCGSGAGGGGGDTESPGVRPPSLPPEAENPTLELTASFTIKVNGIVTVAGSLTNSSTDAAVSSTTVTAVAVSSGGTEVSSGTGTTDSAGSYSITLNGVSNGDVIWVSADSSNTVTKTIVLDGVVSTFVGTGVELSVSGTGTSASVATPHSGVIDADGTYLYVSELTGNKISRITLADGTAAVFVGAPSGSTTSGDANGSGTDVRLTNPKGVTIDSDGIYMYIAETGGNKIRRVTMATGVVDVFAGPDVGSQVAGCVNGSAGAARFNAPAGVIIVGDYLYVSDGLNHRVRKIHLTTKEVSDFAGPSCSLGQVTGLVDGTGTDVRFNWPVSITKDPDGTYLYISDIDNNVVRRATIATGVVTTIIGSTSGTSGDTDGKGTAVRLYSPRGLVLDPTGKLFYIEDEFNNKIRRSVIADDYNTTVFTGPAAGTTTVGCADGTGTDARFNHPAGLAVAPDGRALYVMDANCHAIRKIQ